MIQGFNNIQIKCLLIPVCEPFIIFRPNEDGRYFLVFHMAFIYSDIRLSARGEENNKLLFYILVPPVNIRGETYFKHFKCRIRISMPSHRVFDHDGYCRVIIRGVIDLMVSTFPSLLVTINFPLPDM